MREEEYVWGELGGKLAGKVNCGGRRRGPYILPRAKCHLADLCKVKSVYYCYLRLMHHTVAQVLYRILAMVTLVPTESSWSHSRRGELGKLGNEESGSCPLTEYEGVHVLVVFWYLPRRMESTGYLDMISLVG